MTLSMRIEDVAVARFEATLKLDGTALADDAKTLTLDAMPSLSIASVTVNGAKAEFTHASEKLVIKLPRAADKGQACRFEIRYTAESPFYQGSGLIFLKERPASSVREAKSPLIYSQGEANWARYWIPCHDWPEEKLTTELIVDVPEGQMVISNGHIVELQKRREGDKTRAVWHWLQDRPHSPYLIMLAVGEFDTVNVGRPMAARSVQERAGGAWFNAPVYGPKGSGTQLGEVFANTPNMVEFYAQRLDQPYAWDKYAQVIVRSFRWGGMENTSATVLAEFAARGSKGSQDDLIAHELAHQWFGDLVTCQNWNHLWLNEGWATYAVPLWVEHSQGQAAYLRSMQAAKRGIVGGRNPRAPEDSAMVSPSVEDPDEEFTKADNPYSKGGFILHMLRTKLGDAAFFKGVHAYLAQQRYQNADTDVFMRALEASSGQDLRSFFDQWCRRPGFPAVSVTWKADPSAGTLTIETSQTQRIDAANPLYVFDLPVAVDFADGGPATRTEVLRIDQAKQSFRLPIAGDVRKITADPLATVLVAATVKRAADGEGKSGDTGSSKE